ARSITPRISASTTVLRPAPAVAMIPPTDRESREPSIRNRCATERFTTERFTRHHAHPDTEDVVHTVDTRTPAAAEDRTSASDRKDRSHHVSPRRRPCSDRPPPLP